MNAVREVLRFVVFLYFLVLIGRVVFDWIRIFAREWRPRGAALLVAEPIYTLTEPPAAGAAQGHPRRCGWVGSRIDLSFMVLFFIVYLLLDPVVSALCRSGVGTRRGCRAWRST